MRRVRLSIPFQRTNKIQVRLIKAIIGNYGEKDYGLLRKNCEHLATLCLTGIPFSTQTDMVKKFMDDSVNSGGNNFVWLIDGIGKILSRVSNYRALDPTLIKLIQLLEEARDYEKKLNEEVTPEKVKEEIEKFITNRLKQIK